MSIQEQIFTLGGVDAGIRGRWRQSSFLGGIPRREVNRLLRQASPKYVVPPSEITDPTGEILVASLSGREVRIRYIEILQRRGVSRATIAGVRSLLEC